MQGGSGAPHRRPRQRGRGRRRRVQGVKGGTADPSADTSTVPAAGAVVASHGRSHPERKRRHKFSHDGCLCGSTHGQWCVHSTSLLNRNLHVFPLSYNVACRTHVENVLGLKTMVSLGLTRPISLPPSPLLPPFSPVIMNLVVVTVMDALSKNNVGLQTRNSKLEQENAWLQEMLKVRVGNASV